MSFRSFANRDTSVEEYDVIFVGAGPAGLTTASLLGKYSKNKKLKMLVLEAHDETPGGCLHSFTCGGISFCSGVHYLGRLSGLSAAVWSDSTGGQTWRFDDTNVIDTLYIEGKPAIPFSPSDWEKKMGFTKKAAGRVSGKFLWIAMVKLLWYPFAVIAWFYFTHFGGRAEAEMDWAEWCKKETGKKEVDPIWFCESGDWSSVHTAQNPGQSCAMLAGAVVKHYCEGVSYFDGGFTETVRGMAKTANERGATILIDAKVDEITFDEKTGAANGVMVKGVHFKTPKIVVSGAHALQKLTGKRCPKNIANAISSLGESPKHGVVFLAYKNKRAADLGLGTGPKWIMAPSEITKGYFVSYKESPAGTGVYIIWEMPYVKRGRDYLEKKEEYADAAKKYIFKMWPKLAEHELSGEDAATPATTEHYVQGFNGCSYGLDTPTRRYFDFDIVRALRPETELPGVYLTGQDTLAIGITSAMMNGALTAQAILFPSILDLIKGNNVMKMITDEYYAKKKKMEGTDNKKK